MIEIVKIRKVEKLGGFRLRLHFSDGTVREHGCSDVVAEDGPIAVPLRSRKFFGRVFLQLGALTWPNGYALDSIALNDEMKKAGLLRKSAA
jgi:hypothetical protein